MPKYFLNTNVIKNDGKVFVSGTTVHHLLHVLRYKPGQTAVFCDGNGTDFYCVYEGYDHKKEILSFLIQDELKCFNELPYKVTLYQSVIAAGKMEIAIQKSVELGVSRIVPVYTKYSAAKTSDLGKKNERYQKIAENAAEQSMRGLVSEVLRPIDFEDLITGNKSENLWLAAYEKERSGSITKAVNAVNNTDALEIGIWVGPEGGFAEEEITSLKEVGTVVITLGRRILRAETAGPAILVQLQCALQAEAF